MPFARVRNRNTETLPNRQIEVVYASAHRLKVVHIDFKPMMRVADVIRESGLLKEFPEIDMTHNAVGIYGRRVSLEQRLEAGDRVEIYRTLQCSPQDARRRRSLENG